MSIIDRIIEDEEEAIGSAPHVSPLPTGGTGSRSEDPMGLLEFRISGPTSSSAQLPPLTIPSLVYAQLLDRAAGAAGAPAPPAIAAGPTPLPLSVSRADLNAAEEVGAEPLTPSDDESPFVGGGLIPPPTRSSPPATSSHKSLDSAVVALARYQLEQRVRRLPEDSVTPTAR